MEQTQWASDNTQLESMQLPSPYGDYAPNPYETTHKSNDYGLSLPPPPQYRRKIGYLVTVLAFATILGLLSGSGYYLLSRPVAQAHQVVNHTQTVVAVRQSTVGTSPTQIPTPTSVPAIVVPTQVPTPIPTQAVPTQAPIPTPIPTQAPVPTQPPAPTPQPVDANSVYQSVIGQLDSNHTVNLQGSDTNWSGWPYAPSHGALVWTDSNPDGVYTVEVAVFNSTQAAQADYQCQYNGQCSKSSYQGNQLQGTYNGRCLYMDNNYSGNGGQYSDYMVDVLSAFNNVPGCSN